VDAPPSPAAAADLRPPRARRSPGGGEFHIPVNPTPLIRNQKNKEKLLICPPLNYLVVLLLFLFVVDAVDFNENDWYWWLGWRPPDSSRIRL
jgi:hypothetical protein